MLHAGRTNKKNMEINHFDRKTPHKLGWPCLLRLARPLTAGQRIPDNLSLLRQLRVAVASGQDSNLARFQALNTWLHFIQSLYDKNSVSYVDAHVRLRDSFRAFPLVRLLRKGLKFCCHDLW